MKKKKTRITLIICGTIILIGLFIILYYYQKENENYNSIKIDKDKFLVYSKMEKVDNEYPKYIPFININSDSASRINQDIDIFINNYIDKDKSTISYEYNISGIYLSVVVKIEDFNIKYGPDVGFRTYVINLKNLQLVEDDKLLELFNINESQVSKIIEYEFKNYYEDLIEDGYFSSSKCDYSCFLHNRSVSNYIDNTHYYIKNGDLVVYKPFVFYSALGDGDYFETDNYEFILVESEKK